MKNFCMIFLLAMLAGTGLYAQSPCGTSGTYTKNLTIPSPSPNCMLMPGTDDKEAFTEALEREGEDTASAPDFEFRFFPVPAENHLYIESKAEAPYSLQIINMEGKIMRENRLIQPGISELQLDLRSLIGQWLSRF